MRLEGTVSQLRDVSPDVEVSLTNVRRVAAAEWREYSNGIAFKVADTQAKAFFIGRRIRVEITPL